MKGHEGFSFGHIASGDPDKQYTGKGDKEIDQ